MVFRISTDRHMRTSFLFVICALLHLTSVPQEMEIDFKSGKSMYDAWCARCHGLDGKGGGEGLELEVPAPDFTDCSFNSREPRKDWKAVISHGGGVRGLSMSMPAWGEALSEEQIELLIDYVKTFCNDSRWPQGELNFRRPQVTTKAFPENEALFIPTYTQSSAKTSTAKFVYEERIGPRGQWEVALPFVSNVSTFLYEVGDLEVSGKLLLFDHFASLTLVSAGWEVGVPTGNKARGTGSGTWKVAPYLAAGKGYESFFLQSSVKYEQPMRGNERKLFYNVALTYPLTTEKKGLIPMLELNVVTSLPERRSSLYLTPQLYIGLVKRGHVALSIGAQLPIAGEGPFDYKVLGFLLWEYADGGLWW